MINYIKNTFFILVKPISTIIGIKNDTYKDALIFYAFVSLIGALLYFLASVFHQTENIPGVYDWGLVRFPLLFVISYLSFFVTGIFLVLFISLIIHFFLLFTSGGAGDYKDTFTGVIYSGTPAILFLWLTRFFEVFYVLIFLLIWFGIITYLCIGILKDKNKVQAVLVTIFVSAVLFGLIYLNYGLEECQYCMA